MTDDEIIKCLRHCRAGDCENCKALNVCDATFSFHKEALDLINRQKEEIDRLNIELQSMRSAANSYKMHYEKTQTQIEKLTLEIEEANEAYRESETQALKESKENAKLFCEAINHAKSEAVKEFVDMFKRNATVIHKTHSGKHLYEIDDDELDNLVKERKEEKEK